MTLVKRYANRLTALALWAGAFVGMTAVILTMMFWFSGTRPIIVTSGSMEPTIPVGSLVIGKKIEIADTAIGDIVTVKVTANKRVTHRVAGITGTGAATQLWLKGDANSERDLSPVASKTMLKQRYTFPELGKPMLWLASPPTWIASGVCLGAIGLLLLRRVGGTDNVEVINDEFLVAVSEEIRGSLTPIVGYVEMLTDGSLPDDEDARLQALKIVARNADRLTEVAATLA